MYFPGLISQSEVRVKVHWEGSETVEPISDDKVTSSNLDDVHRESYELTNSVDLSQFGRTIRIPMGHKIFARSGDKGSNANIGFFPQDDTQEAWDWLRSFLSIKKMLKLLGDEAQTVSREERVEFTNMQGIYFVLFDYIGGSVVDTSSADSLAKVRSIYSSAMYLSRQGTTNGDVLSGPRGIHQGEDRRRPRNALHRANNINRARFL